MSAFDHNAFIDRLGGTRAAAAIFGVLPSAVSNWRKTGIPRNRHSQVLIEAKARGIRVTAAQLMSHEGSRSTGAEAA